MVVEVKNNNSNVSTPSKHQHHIDGLKKALEESNQLLRYCFKEYPLRAPEAPIRDPLTGKNTCKTNAINAVEATESRIAILKKMENNEPITQDDKALLLRIPYLAADADIAKYDNFISEPSKKLGR